MHGSALPSNNERISNKGGNGHIIGGKAASCVARDELASARRDTGLLLASPSIAETQTYLRAAVEQPCGGADGGITSASSEISTMRREAGGFYALGKDQAKQEIKKWYVHVIMPNSAPISTDRCRDVI